MTFSPFQKNFDTKKVCTRIPLRSAGAPLPFLPAVFPPGSPSRLLFRPYAHCPDCLLRSEGLPGRHRPEWAALRRTCPRQEEPLCTAHSVAISAREDLPSPRTLPAMAVPGLPVPRPPGGDPRAAALGPRTLRSPDIPNGIPPMVRSLARPSGGVPSRGVRGRDCAELSHAPGTKALSPGGGPPAPGPSAHPGRMRLRADRPAPDTGWLGH